MSTTPPTLPDETNADFLKIDELALDREWLGQSELYFTHAVKAAKAQRTRDRCKAELDVTKAEVDELIRAKPEKYGVTKLTEGNISAAIARHARYKEASEALNAAQYRFNIRNAALTALEHRKRALTMLVDLHNSNYFADPKVAAGRKTRESLDEQAQARAAKRTQVRRENEAED